MRYTGPKCRLCRREGMKLFLKGEKCFSTRCPIEKRNRPPGLHGKGVRKLSEYGKQLREKQKTKRYFGVLTEKSFRKVFQKAMKAQGDTGQNIIKFLKLRLDYALYESGLVDSKHTARQLVNHGFFKVNDRAVNIPSIQLKVGDKVTLKKTALKDNVFGAKEGGNKKNQPKSPRWLKTDFSGIAFEVIDEPKEKELIIPEFNPQSIVEYYSR